MTLLPGNRRNGTEDAKNTFEFICLSDLNKTSSRLLTDKALKLKKQIEKNVSQKAN